MVMLALRVAGDIILTSIMPSTTCSNCGAEIADGTRFCRRCGQPSAVLNEASILEATTRTLETHPGPGSSNSSASTQFFSSEPTGPAYLAPNMVGAAPSEASPAQTNRNLQAPPRSRNILIFSALTGVVLVVLVALLMGWVVWRSVATTVRREIVRVGPPAIAPPVPPIPPVPPLPPEARAGGISRSLIYPGAEVVMDMIRGEEGDVLQLSTSDSLDKVVKWYDARLKPNKKIILPGRNAILRGEEVTAIITDGDDDQVSIVIKQEP